MKSQAMLAAARRLLDRKDARTAGIWPRAAALLARQALEHGIEEFWRSKGVALDTLATRPQLICLPRYLGNRELAGRAAHAWASLTRACHHHPYDLPPGHAELGNWLTSVGDILSAMESA